VEHSAVVARLVAANAGFLLKQGEVSAGRALKDPPGGGESDGAAPDNKETLPLS